MRRLRVSIRVLSFLFSLINPLAQVATEIAKAKIAMANAQTDQEKIHAEERVKSLEARRDMLVARGSLQADESKVSTLNIVARTFLFAVPVGVVIWKILVWDKALGQWSGGHTDALSEQDKSIIVSVIGFYFLVEGATTVTRIMKR